MSSRTVTFECDFAARRSRLTTFFRGLLLIPHWIALVVVGLLVAVAVIVAWFALVITGRWPQGLYGFVAGGLRYAARVHGYALLLADPYPPFSLAEEDGYPIRLRIPPPQASYSRLKVLVRILLVIPVLVIAYVMGLLAGLGSFIAWFVIVVTGRQPEGLQELITLGFSYQARCTTFLHLLTEDWPAVTDATPVREL